MGKIKKIVWYSSGLIQSGGGERLILEGVKYFEKVGIETHLLVYNFDEKATFEGTYKPNIHILEKNREKNDFFPVKLFMSLKRLLILRKQIRSINPDIIISQGQWGDSVHLYIATLFTPFPHAVHIFGSVFSFSDEFSKYALVFRRHFNEIRQSVVGYKEVVPTRLPKLGLVRRRELELSAILKYLSVKKAKRIFVLSNQNKWEVKKLYGKDAIVLKGALPPHIFDYKPKENIKQKLGLMDKKMILNINRLVPKKRVDLCIKAFEKIANKIENAILVIGGIGPDEKRLRDLVKGLNLEGKVKFVGYVKEKELWDYYACCDVFVQLDIADFNIAPYEALALGCKVIWSTEMEIDENLKRNRFIFSADPEVKGVAEVIEKALTTDLGSMDPIEKQILSRYSWDNYFGEILRELERV